MTAIVEPALSQERAEVAKGVSKCNRVHIAQPEVTHTRGVDEVTTPWQMVECRCGGSVAPQTRGI